eukprot:gene10009-18635_t
MKNTLYKVFVVLSNSTGDVCSAACTCSAGIGLGDFEGAFVYGCGESASAAKGVSVHIIPHFGDKTPIAVSRRKRWTDFVERTWKNWKAMKTSEVCSKHFETEDFGQPYASQDALPGFEGSFRRSLSQDEYGICSYPSIYPPTIAEASTSKSVSTHTSRPSGRAHRQIIHEAMRDCNAQTASEDAPETGSRSNTSRDRQALESNHNDFFEPVSCVEDEQPSILHFELIQRNEVGSSSAMEYEGFKRYYVSELFETILNMTAEEKEQAMVELHNATPQPLCAEFDKETREEAVEKRTKRQNMCMQEVPATCLVAESNTTEAAPRKLQKSPHCRLCNNPMKGHKDISDCPRNNRQ